MLPRNSTRIELRPEDKEEYELIKKQRQQQQELQQHIGPDLASAQVEVKLRLLTAEDHVKLAQLLAPGHEVTYEQENYFFDGPDGELNRQRVVLRVRLFDSKQSATLTLKGKQLLVNGIGTASEVEESLEPAVGAAAITSPNTLLGLDSNIMRSLAKQYSLSSLICLGGFKNQRQMYNWEGCTLELDQTQYEWGTLYELECETAHPEELRDKLEALLSSHSIAYKYSTASKFANFVNRTLE